MVIPLRSAIITNHYDINSKENTKLSNIDKITSEYQSVVSILVYYLNNTFII